MRAVGIKLNVDDTYLSNEHPQPGLSLQSDGLRKYNPLYEYVQVCTYLLTVSTLKLRIRIAVYVISEFKKATLTNC